MRRYEILAPAGNADSLVCAVNNGADAVYLGLDNFNARMKADNFTSYNLAQWVDYCHLFGVKVYVTLNTSIKQAEMQDACRMLCDIYNSNADGVIVTDLWLLKFAGEHFAPPFEIVASTQLNIHDVDGAMLAKSLGATTVVLARETDSTTVRQIAKQCDVKLECFIHGALCVCQSGQCLLSSISGGNSGNRGRCAQPCRQMYSCTDANGKDITSGYLLSPKDWCGARVAEKMYNDGVSVFKIEGRNRRSTYSGGASEFYSSLFANGFRYDNQQLDQLKTLYNRGDYLYDGYYGGRNDNIIYPKVQSHIGVVVGEYRKGRLIAKRAVSKSDGFKLLRNGYECGSAVALESGNNVKLSVSESVRDGDIVCITTDNALNEKIANNQRKIRVSLTVSAKAGDKLCLVATNDSGVSVQYQSQYVCAKADKIVTHSAEIVQQLSKTGNTHYTIADIVCYADAVFVPKSVLNDARRSVLQLFEKAIIDKYNASLNRHRFVFDADMLPHWEQYAEDRKAIAVTCFDRIQFEKAMSNTNIDVVIVKTETLDNATCKLFDSVADKQWYVDVPSFTNGEYLQKCLDGCKHVGIAAHNLGTVGTAMRLGLNYICHTGMNIYNGYMAQLLTHDFEQQFVYSAELTLQEIKQIGLRGFVFVDGDLTVMKTVHCPYKLCFDATCATCKFRPFEYTDTKGNKLFIRRRKADICTFELYNGVKLSVADKHVDANYLLVDYNERVIEHFVSVVNGKEDNYEQTVPFTRGRLFNKVN